MRYCSYINRVVEWNDRESRLSDPCFHPCRYEQSPRKSACPISPAADRGLCVGMSSFQGCKGFGFCFGVSVIGLLWRTHHLHQRYINFIVKLLASVHTRSLLSANLRGDCAFRLSRILSPLFDHVGGMRYSK